MWTILRKSFKELGTASNLSFSLLINHSKITNYPQCIYFIIPKLTTVRYYVLFHNEEHEDTIPYDYKSYLKVNRPAKSRTSRLICELFDMTNDEANDYIIKYPGLSDLSVADIKNRYKMCTELGLNKDIIRALPWLLTESEEWLRQRIDILKSLEVDINVVIGLAKLANVKVVNVISSMKAEKDSIPTGNRISYLSERLQCSPVEVTNAIIKYPFIQKMPFYKIENVLNILLSKGVDPKYIIRDVWVFNYRPQLIESRLQEAINAKVKVLKPWLTRCKTSIFERTLQRQRKNHMILGDKSTKIDYLSERLNLPYETTRMIFDKYPEIRRMNMSKMKEILDFLFDEGFTSDQISRWPRILFSKSETVRNRLKKLKEVDHVPTSLVVLSKSQKQFKIYYDMVHKKFKKQ